MPRGMNTMTIELGSTVDTYGVAIAALNGAVSVMVAAGLNESEIAALLLQTANSELATPAHSHTSEWEDESEETGTSIYDIEEDFEQTSIYKALSRLAKRAEPLNNQGTVEACGKLEKLIEEAIPQMKDAAEWYQSACANSGIKFEVNRQLWLEAASDEELDAEDDYLFYDASRAAHAFGSWIISDYARWAERLGRADEIGNVQDLIVGHGVFIESEILDEIDQARRNSSFKEVVQWSVEALESGFEMPQAEFMRRLAEVSENEVPEHLLSTWIDMFEDAGLLERHKRSNRWQIRRI
jgi:hypothetical protein